MQFLDMCGIRSQHWCLCVPVVKRAQMLRRVPERQRSKAYFGDFSGGPPNAQFGVASVTVQFDCGNKAMRHSGTAA